MNTVVDVDANVASRNNEARHGKSGMRKQCNESIVMLHPAAGEWQITHWRESNRRALQSRQRVDDVDSMSITLILIDKPSRRLIVLL